MDNKHRISNLNNCVDLLPYKANFNFSDLTVVPGGLSELRREQPPISAPCGDAPPNGLSMTSPLFLSQKGKDQGIKL